jgi:hypothetical protein
MASFSLNVEVWVFLWMLSDAYIEHNLNQVIMYLIIYINVFAVHND